MRTLDEPTPYVDDLAYAEGLRWHDGSLWYSDMMRDVVERVRDGGPAEPVVRVRRPSGLGFTADGRILVVSIEEDRLYSAVPGRDPELVVDLAPFGGVHTNDMLVTGTRCYIGSSGRGYEEGDEVRVHESGVGTVLLVDHTTGDVRVVAEGLALPNGMVTTADGRHLLLAETFRRRILSYVIDRDGGLSEPRVVASFGDWMVDGIAIDAADRVWAGLPNGERFARIDASGAITDVVPVPGWSTVCPAVGGPAGRDLFLAVCQMSLDTFFAGESRGRILTTEVPPDA